jgi:DNA-binding MarR family transcriptional regulator
MRNTNPSLQFLLTLAKAETVISRRFDRGLGGLGLSEFIILYHLNRAEGNALSRVELAEKIGFTASGVTRLLLPMEKVGLIKRATDPADARISLVRLAPGGQRHLEEAMERAELLLGDLIPDSKTGKIEELSELLSVMAAGIR